MAAVLSRYARAPAQQTPAPLRVSVQQQLKTASQRCLRTSPTQEQGFALEGALMKQAPSAEGDRCSLVDLLEGGAPRASLHQKKRSGELQIESSSTQTPPFVSVFCTHGRRR